VVSVQNYKFRRNLRLTITSKPRYDRPEEAGRAPAHCPCSFVGRMGVVGMAGAARFSTSELWIMREVAELSEFFVVQS
jgi:hypothetical protein